LSNLLRKYSHSSSRMMYNVQNLAIAVSMFLATTSSGHIGPSEQDFINRDDVEMNLWADIENILSEGEATTNVELLENLLMPMYLALPKNEHGHLGHATVRYALHRFFAQRNTWFIKGLHNSSAPQSLSPNGFLEERIPSYLQALFEQRLDEKGFGLHELSVVASMVQRLVSNEVVKRLGDAYKVHGRLPTSKMKLKEMDEVLETYMMAFILGENLSNVTLQNALDMKADMPDIFGSWNATRAFMRSLRRNISAEDQVHDGYKFSFVAKVAERFGEQFGSFQNKECRQIKASLVALEEPGIGRVRLGDFWAPALNGTWQFQESFDYLQLLGALDQSDANNPRVMIANYIASPSNCVASSNFYSICCVQECDVLLSQLEAQIAAPKAKPQRIAELVMALTSTSVAAPRELSPSLLHRLDEIADEHDGSIWLHGRLFAQWMHHAFPRECPYPHLSGTTNPLTPDEWVKTIGKDESATEEEMKAYAAKARLNDALDAGMVPLPWSSVEELLVHPAFKQQDAKGIFIELPIRNSFLVTVLVTLTYGFIRAFRSSTVDSLDCPDVFRKSLVWV